MPCLTALVFARSIIIDDCNREVLAIEVDISLRAERVIRVLDRLKAERELPHMIRVDRGPEFLSQQLHEWGKANRVLIYHIQPDCLTQNAFIARFNRTYLNEVLNLSLFRSFGLGPRDYGSVDDDLQ